MISSYPPSPSNPSPLFDSSALLCLASTPPFTSLDVAIELAKETMSSGPERSFSHEGDFRFTRSNSISSNSSNSSFTTSSHSSKTPDEYLEEARDPISSQDLPFKPRCMYSSKYSLDETLKKEIELAKLRQRLETQKKA